MRIARQARCAGLIALVAWPLLAAANPEGAAAPAQNPAPAPAAGAATPAPADAAPAPAAPDNSLKTGDEAYELKIKTLEERVNELKEKIFRSKQRLAQLQEAVVGGVSSGAKARIVHKNQMGNTFKLKEMHYFLDGAPLRQEVDGTGNGLQLQEEFDLFDGAILPGNHQITVNLVYQGAGFGVFSYMEGYNFKIRSSHTFTAEEGKEVNLKVVAYEQGNATTELKDRPTVRYDMEIKPLQRKGGTTEGGGEAAKGGAAP